MFIQLNQCIRNLALALFANSLLQASAFAFSMFPVRLSIDASHNVATLSVSNPSDEDITVQPRVFKWTQDSTADGTPNENLTDSKAFTIFPPIVKLKPQSKQTIRIRYNGNVAGEKEEAFRVVTENLLLKPTPGVVNFTNAISIPLFVKAKVDRNPELTWTVKYTGLGAIRLDMNNALGNRHIQIKGLTASKVDGTHGGDAAHVVTDSFMQYLLPNAKGSLTLNKWNLPAGKYLFKLATDYKELEQFVELK